jgi:nitrogen fixation protein FixH
VSLLITLPVGILLILLFYFGLQRFVTKTPLRTGFVTGIVTTVVYVAFAIRFWQGGDVFAVHIALYIITVYILTVTGHQRYTSGSTGRMHWAPAAIVGFFVVIVSIDSVFVVFAQRGIGPDWARHLLPTPQSGNRVESRFPGIVSHDFHEKEAQFNAYQAERAKQKTLGWQSHIGWQDTAEINKSNRLLVTLKDVSQQAIENASISGHFLFPGDAKQDHVFTMHALGGGMYAADLSFSRAGTWDLVLSISRNSDKLELRTTTTIEHPQARHE